MIVPLDPLAAPQTVLDGLAVVPGDSHAHAGGSAGPPLRPLNSFISGSADRSGPPTPKGERGASLPVAAPAAPQTVLDGIVLVGI
jgi:hypothetical protein